MTNLIEEQLAEGMRERVEGMTAAPGLVNQVLRVQRRRVLITRTAYAVGVVGLAGAVAASALTIDANGPAAQRNRPAATAADSPQLRLVAAVTASRGTSYHMKNTIRVHSPGKPPIVIEGAFDPATTTGYLRMSSDTTKAWYEERVIDGDLYTANVFPGEPIPWWHEAGKHTGLTADPKIGVPGVSADPRQMLDVLTQAGATITQTGPDTFHFTVALTGRNGVSLGSATGDVTVGSDHRIAKVVYESTIKSPTRPSDVTVIDATLELSGYGSPVAVERPPGTFEDLGTK
jgi:hypothetical protein